MPDEDRPRRAVPAWVTAPPEGSATPASAPSVAADGLEARPTPAAPAPVPETAAPGDALPTVPSAPALSEDDIVVPDYPPQEELLPPAPTSPAVHTVPFDTAATAPTPVSPIDAAPPAAAVPAVPVVGQPRFSVPGLEHVVVAGSVPEPTGPIGYRTPARFARQQAPLAAPAPAPSFDAVIAAPAAAPTTPATVTGPADDHVASPAPDAPTTEASVSEVAEPGLQTDATRPRGPLVGATPGALLGAVAGLATLGLAAWWFLQPATVHGVGLALGAVAVLVSIVTLRNRAATWQRPIALLGAVLGGVGTLVLLWAVASAVLPAAGVTLPDLTGTGTAPTLAP
ncbi:hypothetical protein ACRQ4B_09410 [Curtobacterium sp. SP.BCo]|uniref:hypothetical protein n=1 Tax=Curtobacterium sp. SP.BCo TaxID=3435229 RepID=UPI003F736B2C